MSGSMFQLESSNIQNILIALVVICAIVYGFIEFRKLNTKMTSLESKLNKLEENLMVLPPRKDIQEQGIQEQGIQEQGIQEQGIQEQEFQEQEFQEQEFQEQDENIIEQSIIEDQSMEQLSVEESVKNNIDYTDPLIDKIINDVEDDSKKEVAVEEVAVEEVAVEEVAVEEVAVEEVAVEEVAVEEVAVEEVAVEEATEEVAVEGAKEEVESKMESFTINFNENSENNDNLNYENLSIKELKNILEEIGLSTTGNKSKLIERINSNKNKI
jgi:hypothetical protein